MNRKLDRPQRLKRQETCLAGWIKVNSVDAFTLFDSGSNTEALSLAFAQVSNTLTQKLENQHRVHSIIFRRHGIKVTLVQSLQADGMYKFIPVSIQLSINEERW